MSFSKLVLVGESSISASSLFMDLSSTEGVGAGLGLLELQQLSSGGGVLWVPTSLVLLHTFFSATWMGKWASISCEGREVFE